MSKTSVSLEERRKESLSKYLSGKQPQSFVRIVDVLMTLVILKLMLVNVATLWTEMFMLQGIF